MNVSRNFMLLGSAFLILGVVIGMYMGGSGDHSLAASHAHINLLGFVLSAVFVKLAKSRIQMCMNPLRASFDRALEAFHCGQKRLLLCRECLWVAAKCQPRQTYCLIDEA